MNAKICQLCIIHPSIHCSKGLSTRRCPISSSPPFSTCRDPAPSCWVCGFLLRTIPWCRPIILCTVFLSSSVPPSFQTSSPSPAYCYKLIINGLNTVFLLDSDHWIAIERSNQLDTEFWMGWLSINVLCVLSWWGCRSHWARFGLEWSLVGSPVTS